MRIDHPLALSSVATSTLDPRSVTVTLLFDSAKRTGSHTIDRKTSDFAAMVDVSLSDEGSAYDD